MSEKGLWGFIKNIFAPVVAPPANSIAPELKKNLESQVEAKKDEEARIKASQERIPQMMKNSGTAMSTGTSGAEIGSSVLNQTVITEKKYPKNVSVNETGA